MKAILRPAQPSRLCQALGWALELGEETAPLLGLTICPQLCSFPEGPEAWSTVL